MASEPKQPKVKRHLFAKTFLPIGWLGQEIQGLKSFTRSVVNTVKSILTKQTAERQESFDEALARLGITKADAMKTASRYRVYAFVFAGLGILLFAYSFYLLFAYFTLIGWLLGLAATAYCLSQAFRFDFWAYQIKVQRLGVSFKEWKQHLLGKTGKTL
jgi:hypothetical protein